MKNILILDLFQHIPFLKTIFPDSDYYFGTEGNGIDVNTFISYYSFGKHIDSLTDLKKHYDIIFVSFPTEDVYLYDKHNLTSSEWQLKYQSFLDKLYKIINKISHDKLCLFDSGDYPFVDLEWFESKKYNFDVLFKVEYRKIAQFSYTEKIKSFPYMLFGFPCPLWFFLNKQKYTYPSIDACYWGNGALGHPSPNLPECYYHDRLNLFNKIYSHIYVDNNRTSFDKFIDGMSNYKYFVILNGSGKVHRRLFEGLACNSLPLIEANDVIYPKELYSPSSNLYFNSAEDFISKLNYFKTHPEATKKEQQLQYKSLENTLNTNVLSEYLLKM